MESAKTQHEELREQHHQLRMDFEDRMRSIMKNGQTIEHEEFLKKPEARHNQKRPPRDGQLKGRK